ncbi:hypothetical protein [Archangium sp.]|uniref:hypothetical protein n=1 Tax=Archangium sp. TaxID=1872627 RepID=UPI002D70129C|nr:hypothetical protein [Archangium sp.]HYO58944.1 hypothetical protein [Archangium sp.]
MRLDTMAGGTFLRLEDGVLPAEDGPRLALVTRGEELARLLEGAMACSFSHEVPESPEEDEAVERFLRDCSEYSDVQGLPESLREEMEEHFARLLDALWKLDWLVFGEARETTLVPGAEPVRGRAVTLCLARYDSPSVEMDARLRRYMASFKEALMRIQGRSDAGEGGAGTLLH